jgi:hypothetical protein
VITVRTWRGAQGEPSGEVVVSPHALAGSPTWGLLTARLRGVPVIGRTRRRGTIADLATATAGFRDQFYGLVPHVDELPDAPRLRPGPRLPALVTSGLIDPAYCAWGERPARFAGRRLLRPVVRLADLDAADARLAAWVRRRLRPKVLVATQGPVLEAVADPAGVFVPSVPVIAVEPEPGPDEVADVWRLLAVLVSPMATAWAVERYGGAGLAAGSVKLAASQVLDVPVPAGRDALDEAASRCRQAAGTTHVATRRGLLDDSARLTCEAYGMTPSLTAELCAWWRRRLGRPPRPTTVVGTSPHSRS